MFGSKCGNQSTKYIWKPISIDVPQRYLDLFLILGMIIFLNLHLDNVRKSSLRGFVDSIKDRGATDALEGKASIQIVLVRTEKWPIRNFMKFNKVK